MDRERMQGKVNRPKKTRHWGGREGQQKHKVKLIGKNGGLKEL